MEKSSQSEMKRRKYNQTDAQETNICSNSKIETQEKGLKYVHNEENRTTWMTSSRRCSSAFAVNFEHILHLCLVFVLLTLNIKMLSGWWLKSICGRTRSSCR